MKSRQQQRRGVAVIEFAIIAPVFVLFVLGMIEIGRAIMVQQILTNASREGARRAILEQTTNAEVETVVRDYLSSCGVNKTAAAIDLEDSVGGAIPNVSSIAFGQPITVEVSIPYDSVSWLPTSSFMGSTTMTASCTMRAERPE